MRILLFICLFLSMGSSVASPSVFPTGTTIYDPGKAWNGFTLLSILDTRGAVLVDMNGRVVQRWPQFNLMPGGPARILPGGNIIGSIGSHPPHQEALALIALDYNGNELWRFDRSERVKTAEGEFIWSARQHHDWQRIDFPAGYFAPGRLPLLTGSRTLLLTHSSHSNNNVSGVPLEDDRLVEVSGDGHVEWQWLAANHIDELGFNTVERATIRSAPGVSERRPTFDWLHINSATYLGPNHWYEDGDMRFSPENIIISSRQASIIAIIARTGSIVWQIGPDFTRSEQERRIKQIIGQHHAHMIPEGLPGSGNILIFDNGGSSGYGAPSPIADNGLGIYARASSRVLEINPATLEIIWTYAAPNFFSTNISSTQRLLNGNTLITEGASGRVFEVSQENEIVWEYINAPAQTDRNSNAIYRAYRVPYEWVPQVTIPEEVPVTRPDPATFVVPY